MVKNNALYYHILIPIMFGIGTYLFYLAAHISPQAIILPPGIEQRLFMPLDVESMIVYWQGKALVISGWSFGLFFSLSALSYLIQRYHRRLGSIYQKRIMRGRG